MNGGIKRGGWNNPEQVVEGMFGVSRYAMPEGPVYNFLVLTEIDRGRAPGEQLDVPTARLLAEKFPLFGDQYPDVCGISRVEQSIDLAISYCR